jgi:septum formation topological specificity factor MinE
LLICPVYPLNLDSIPYIAFINLRNQSSFCYNYKFKSDTPHDVAGEFKGLVVFPNQEERNGTLIRKDKKINYKIKARGNYQYDISKETKKWQLTPRDIESNLMSTMERTITNTKFYLIKEDSKNYIYSFYPNLVFLDPTFSRKLSATLVVNKKTLLPQSIAASDSAKKIFWQVAFSNYNTKKRIKFPFLQNSKITLSSDTTLSVTQTGNITEVLTKRLELAGENFRIKTKTKGKITTFEINLEIPGENYDYKLLEKLLISPGKLTIHSSNESVPVLDESKISDIRITGFEPYPAIEIILNEAGIHQMTEQLNQAGFSPYKVVLDSSEIGTFNIDKTDFFDRIISLFLTNRNEIMITMAILKGGALLEPLKIITIEGTR